MLPNLIIVGAMKSGTSSLHYYLNLHPEIFMSKPKELDFFVRERNWDKGPDWYRSYFSGDAPVRGESSTSYTQCHKFSGVPERMHSMIPDAKLIYILRDPIDRIPSHYRQLNYLKIEKRTFSEIAADPNNNEYLDTSRYYYQLKKFTPYYPLSKILVLTLEELKNRQQETLKKVFHFLGVDDSFYCSDLTSIRNRSIDKRPKNWLGRVIFNIPFKDKVKGYFPWSIRRKIRSLTASKTPKHQQAPISNELRQKLIPYLQDDVDQLRVLTSKNFHEWCL
ncbi:MAG: hypothetical protein B6244_00005 [Candidatus Cloacimonetes bacterium 4572_55]|nr:MAG: hypothetical protein B6244_00005 [Candidatus Cloacimonetes bacterium 4572_55]